MSSQVFGTGTWIKIRMIEMQRAVYVYVCQNVHNDIETIICMLHRLQLSNQRPLMGKIHFIWMHIFLVQSFFLHFQSSAHVGDLTIQSRIENRSIFIEEEEIECVQFKYMTCLEWDSWTYSQWIIIPNHVPFETVISCGCILSGRWYIEVNSFWSNWQANDLKLDDPSEKWILGKNGRGLHRHSLQLYDFVRLLRLVSQWRTFHSFIASIFRWVWVTHRFYVNESMYLLPYKRRIFLQSIMIRIFHS